LVAADSNETALDRARSIAAEIATRPPRAVAYIKRLVRAAASPVDKDMLKLEGELFADLMTTNEARAGLKGAAAAHRSERTSART
jgi:enoyl-CoA hydratase/carnithine racemase